MRTTRNTNPQGNQQPVADNNAYVDQQMQGGYENNQGHQQQDYYDGYNNMDYNQQDEYVQDVDNSVSSVENSDMNYSEPIQESNNSEDDWFSSDAGNSSGGTDDIGDSTGGEVIEKVEEPVIQLEPLATGRIVGTVFVGILFSAILGLLVTVLFLNFVKYPKKMVYTDKQKGIYHLKNWENELKDINSLSEDYYLNKEITYANGDQFKIDFYQSMMNTVKYTPEKANIKNVYGNEYIDKKTNQPVEDDSVVGVGEEVQLSFIDYENMEINTNMLSMIMQQMGVAYGGTDYANALVDVFCSYMSTISPDTIKMKSIGYTPTFDINKETRELKLIKEAEDEAIDQYLFSSKEFWGFLDRFSEVAASTSAGVTLQPTPEWTAWSALSDEEKEIMEEPTKYSRIEALPHNWCGAYYLQNEYAVKDSKGNIIKKGISATIGDGTVGNPAGLDTPVNTVIYVNEVDEAGNPVVNAYPIKVTLRDFRTSQDAIVWFESKDQRNRGIDVSSEVQYCSYTIEIENLSQVPLTIPDNTTLSDENVNLSGRSGEIFGLVSTLTLQPNEIGLIESWNKSTILSDKYLIWGADFARRSEPVWFRVLAGDIDDESEDKGVTNNKTRYEQETEEETTKETTTEATAEGSEEESAK